MRKYKHVVAATILTTASFAQFAAAADYTGSIAPINVASDETIVLTNATIDARDTAKLSGITIQPGATLTLELKGDNNIYAGACAAGINVMPKYNGQDYDKDGSAKIIIKGDGNLNVYGGRGDIRGDDFQCGTGAGIGGNGSWSRYDGWQDIEEGEWDWNYAPDFGTITVDSDFTGTLTSVSGVANANQGFHNNENNNGSGAGIGGGGTIADSYSPNFHRNLSGEINIKNGTVNAFGYKEGDDEFITGGAGIGTGGGTGGGNRDFHSNIDVTINISGGTVTAKGGYNAAGIGGGSNQNSGIINISGGKINAECGPSFNGSPSGTGIGSGDIGSVQEINITGGDITAKGYASAGIGGGYEATTNNAIFTGRDDSTYLLVTNTTGKINISGADTKVFAISEDNYKDYDEPGDRVRSGAGIGSGAPYLYSSQDYNDYYITYQSLNYDIDITDGATVTAFGGKYANGVGAGGGYFRNAGGAFQHTGINVTVDDTVNLFAANLSDTIPALPSENDATDYYGATPLSFNSANKYLVQRTGNAITANKVVPGNDNTDVEYSLAGTTMTVTVDGNEPTTHETTSNYTDGNSFALISGKAEETTPDDPVTPTVPDDPDTPTDPDDPEVPDVPNTYDGILTSFAIVIVAMLGIVTASAIIKKDLKA